MIDRSTRLRVLAGALAGAALLGSAPVAQAATELRGGGFVSDFSGCDQNGWAGTERVLVRFRPAGQDGNSPDFSSITLLFNSGAINFLIPDQDPSNWIETTSTQIFSGFSLDPVPTQLRLLSISAQIDATTEMLFASFEVNNFSSLEGCSAFIRVALGRR
ncbi:MAG: hypothetical protein KDK12_14145 [Rhodobacteraceae bacterium]|nr:hypothetical protein [Paracoccaceae bacterium]